MTGRYLHARKPRGLEPRTPDSPIGNHVLDLHDRKRCGDRPTQVVGQRGGTDGTVIAPDRMPASPGILHLTQQECALAIDDISGSLEVVQPAVIPGTKPTGNAVVGGHGNRFSNDGRRSPRGSRAVVV